MKAWLRSISTRTPDQVLMVIVAIISMAVITIDLHGVLTRLGSKTGVLMRVEGIEAQVNASAVNMKAITSNVKDLTGDVKEGVAAWKATSQDEAQFIDKTLPALAGGVQGNLDALHDLQVQHLSPAIDQVGGVARSLSYATTQVGDLAGDSSDTLTNHVDPLLDSSKASVDQFNRLVSSPSLAAAMDNGREVSGNLAGMTSDFRARFHEVLYPPKCTTKSCTFSRVVWPALKAAGPMGETVYWWGDVLGRATPVKVVH